MNRTPSHAAPRLAVSALALALSGLSSTFHFANAADVQIYGLVDYGFALQRTSGSAPEATNEWTLSMKSGMRNSSRFGLRGSEDLQNNWRVSFVLENQFLGDSGALQTSGTLWEREASVALTGPYGRFTFGRLGQLKSPIGTTGLAGTVVNPFGSAMSSFIGGLKYVTTGNYFPVNNAVNYTSPKMGGWTLHAQYSFANTAEGTHVDDDDRTMGVAARYAEGALHMLFLVDTTNLKNNGDSSEQPTTVNVAVNYDFGWVKPYVYAQWFRNGTPNTSGSYLSTPGQYDGVGAVFALQWPFLEGKAKVGTSFMKAETADSMKLDLLRTTVALGWDRVVTKTLHVYTNLGFMSQERDTVDGNRRLRGTEVVAGMVKYF